MKKKIAYKSVIAWILFGTMFIVVFTAPYFYLMLHAACEDLCHRGCLELGWAESEISGSIGQYKCYCIKNCDAKLYWDILDEGG